MNNPGLDRLGRRKEAFESYLSSSLNTNAGGVKELLYVHSRDSGYSEPINWSAFRASWLLLTTELGTDKKGLVSELYQMAKVQRKHHWLNDLHQAIRGKEKGSFLKNRLDRMLRKVPEDLQTAVSKFTQQLISGESPRYSLDEDPLYLKTVTDFFELSILDMDAQDENLAKRIQIERMKKLEAERKQGKK